MDLFPPPEEIWASAHELIQRAETNSTSSGSSSNSTRPPAYKAVGLTLAIASGLFIGTSFVLKKVGLLKANAKYNEEAGEGYGYLKNAYWWGGMTLMIVGEICNFVAYAFVDAILVTPLGALSVVITTILSAIFLKERLSFVGKIGCFNCIIGSVVIVMNAPEHSAVADIQEMKKFVIAPGFLSYAGVIIVGCAFIAFWVGPRYGKKSMLVYLSICSLIGGLSVVATQGLGSAVVAQAGGKAQFNQWFLYVLLVFVITTLLVEIVYLNKALNLFNAALVTPTYYVFFTSSTIITSAILFQGFKGGAISITTVIMGFLVICSGVVLLQVSKSAKDVPDAAVFKGDLDQIREIGEVEQPETEPKADAIRGTAALIRRFSVSRQKMEQEEARRLRQDTIKDELEPLRENEVVEWDGLRRRKTVIGTPGSSPVRRRTLHPPLGMSRFPDPEDPENPSEGFFHNLRTRAQSTIPKPNRHTVANPSGQTMQSPLHPVPLTEINVHHGKSDTPITRYGPGSLEEAEEHIYGLPAGLRKEQDKAAGIPAAFSPRSKPLPAKPPPSPSGLNPTQPARRQFSFTNFLNRNSRTPTDGDDRPPTRTGIGSRGDSQDQRRALKTATEEERLGLVKGDSHIALHSEKSHSPERARPLMGRSHSQSSSASSTIESQYPSQFQYPTSQLPRTLSSHADEDDEWQSPSPPILNDSSQYLPSPKVIVPKAGLPQPAFTSASQTQRKLSSSINHPPPPPIISLQHPSLHRQDFDHLTQQSQVAAPTSSRPEQIQERATPPAYAPFPTSSTSQTPYQTRTQTGGDEGSSVTVSGDSRRPQVEDEGDIEDQYEILPKKKYEEQSKREREERRKRLSLGFPPPGSS
jgi:magnesium transporter